MRWLPPPPRGASHAPAGSRTSRPPHVALAGAGPASPAAVAGFRAVAGRGPRRRGVEVALMLVGAVVAMSGLVACTQSAKANGHGVFGAAPNGSPGVGAASGIGSAGASAGARRPRPACRPRRPSHHASSAPSSHAYPSDYARAILTAWGGHDTSYLTLLTNTSTKNQLYGYGSLDQHWTLASSQGATGSSYASFYNRDGDWIVLRSVNDRDGGTPVARRARSRRGARSPTRPTRRPT